LTFQKAISQSGVFDFGRTSMLKQKQLLEYAKDLGNKTACPLDDMFDFVDCLRTKTFDELITATNLFRSMPNDTKSSNICMYPLKR
jgi:carboxylesterase type B